MRTLKFPLFERKIEEVTTGTGKDTRVVGHKVSYSTLKDNKSITKHYSLDDLSGDKLMKLDDKFRDDVKAS